MEANELGQVISVEEYYPHGVSAYRAAASGVDLSLKRYRFTGKERDKETGLDYFGVRYYASWLGRWTSSDPGGFVDGLNLYRYVRNNPVNGVDAMGYNTDPPPITFPENAKKGDTYTPGAEQGTNWTYIYGGQEDGWMPLGNLPEVTVSTDSSDSSSSWWGWAKSAAELAIGFTPAGVILDIYELGNALINDNKEDVLWALVNFLPAGELLKQGKKVFDKTKDFFKSIPQGTRDIIDTDIRSGIERVRRFLEGGGNPPPQLRGAGANIQIDVPPLSLKKQQNPCSPKSLPYSGNSKP